MSNDKKPEIEFPCKYPIKVLGDAHPDLNQHVISVMNAHAPTITESDLTAKNSSKDYYSHRETPVRCYFC